MPVHTPAQDWRAGGGRPPASGPHWTAERTFRRGDAPEVRRLAQAFGSRAGLRGGQLPDFVLAVSEAAACATAHWPGTARVRLWSAGARVYCEIRRDALVARDADAARGVPPGGLPSGGRQAAEEALRRYVLRRVCDYFRVESAPGNARVLLTMAVRGAARDPSGRAGTRRPR